MVKTANENGRKTIAKNKKAHYTFCIKEEFEAGLVLLGWEVKSLRNGNADISGSYITFQNREAFLVGAIFTPRFAVTSSNDYNTKRPRKLLLNQNELNSLRNTINCKGETIVALSLYWKNSWCKLKIGVAKGKKQHDKRNDLKKRDWQIDKLRIIKDINHFF